MEDVVIIGAGAAGLAAALSFEKAKVRYHILEARNRVGGRIHTKRTKASPYPVELGAEFVHGVPPDTWEIIRQENLLAIDMPDRHVFWRRGKLDSSDDFWKKLGSIMGKLTQKGPDQSFSDFLKKVKGVKFQEAKIIARNYVAGFDGADPDLAGVHALAKAEKDSQDTEITRSARLPGGYDKIPEHFLNQLNFKKNTLSLECEVLEIDWSEKVSLIRYRHKSKIRELKARKVLLTVPLPLLAPETGLRFTPPLPLERREALKKVLMGSAAKVVFTFRHRFWEERKEFRDLVFLHAPELPVPVWWTSLSARLPILTGWAGGPPATKLNTLSSKDVEKEALRSLALWLKLPLAKLKKEIVAFHYHNWDRDPFSQGAYSYLGIDGLKAQKILAKPLKQQLFFAGEATHTDGLNGTVDGAITTGFRSAHEIIKSL